MKEIHTRDDLLRCEVGEHIIRDNVVGEYRKGVYAGIEPIMAGSAVCGCATILKLPVIIYLTQDGNIKRQVDPSFEHLSYSLIKLVQKEDSNYQKYKKLLGV